MACEPLDLLTRIMCLRAKMLPKMRSFNLVCFSSALQILKHINFNLIMLMLSPSTHENIFFKIVGNLWSWNWLGRRGSSANRNDSNSHYWYTRSSKAWSSSSNPEMSEGWHHRSYGYRWQYQYGTINRHQLWYLETREWFFSSWRKRIQRKVCYGFFFSSLYWS